MSAKKTSETKEKKIVVEEVSLDAMVLEDKKPAPKKPYINHKSEEEDADWSMHTKKTP